MYAITGITGKVGGELARSLLAAGQSVRAVLRDADKAKAWAALGCDIAFAEMADTRALTDAFSGAKAVFVLLPPVFDPEPGYPEARAVIDAVVAAAEAAKPERILYLSTIGADAVQDNLLSQHTIGEAAFRQLGLPLTVLRPAWFLDNAAWDVASARDSGLLHSYLLPIDRAIPMVAAKDVGRVAADLIQQDWTGTRIFELEGPHRLSPNGLAAAFARILQRPVQAMPVPRTSWEELFRSQGMRNPEPRMRMLDGFNEGWIDFQNGGRNAVRGQTDVDAVVAALVADQKA